MALLLPAIKGKLGTNDYYVATMKAKEIAEKVVIPSEAPDWHHQELDLYFQRDINYTRVRNKVAPYFNKEDDRFSGTIVVALENFEEKVSFQALAGGESQFGLLAIDRNSEFLPIDGQHRALAIKYAISGRDSEGRLLPRLKPNPDLAQEDVPVMIIPFDRDKVRRIFIALNEHAKKPAANENIVISEKIIQALTRSIAASVFTNRLVKRKNKVLELESPEITTLTSMATGTKHIFDACFPELKSYRRNTPNDIGMEYIVIQEAIERHWQTITNSIDFYRLSMLDERDSGDQARIDLKKEWLLSRAYVQDCLIHAFALLIAEEAPFYANEEGAAQALNHLPLRVEQMRHWQPFLFSNNQRVVAGNKRFTTELMVYMASGTHYAEKDKLLRDYRKFFPEEPNKQLPDPVI